jgi:leucyl/phenylalanyl-tRNA--protein transferase
MMRDIQQSSRDKKDRIVSPSSESFRSVQGLSPEFLLFAYANGYFPMATSRTGHIEWYSPDPRAIIPLNSLNVSRSLRRVVAMKKFEIRINTEFERVMRACADRETTWISEEIVRAYVEMHCRGFAHSLECWREGKLVGGLYGVALNGAFFGESMFSRVTDASKVALVHLVERLNARGFVLLDTQFMTEHLRRLGAVEISRAAYLRLLARAMNVQAEFCSAGDG